MKKQISFFLIFREFYKGMNSSVYVNMGSESLNSSANEDPEFLRVSQTVVAMTC